MEKFEQIENLSERKYSRQQFAEMKVALERKEEKNRIVSYNVLFNLYDHNLDEENRWPQRLPRVVELADGMAPDLIGVQELYFSQWRDLKPYLEDQFEFYSRACEDGELNGIFYRKDRFQVLDQKVWDMTNTPDVPSSETLTMLQLKDLKTNKVIFVFNTHLAFSKIEKRDFQARFIARHIEPFVKQMPVILMGDLNTFPARLDLEKLPFCDGDYVHRILTQGSLRDAKDLSILGHLGPVSTFSNHLDDGIPFKGTGTPGVFLDHVYVSSGVCVLMHAVEPGTVEGFFPSDHFPVVVDFFLE